MFENTPIILVIDDDQLNLELVSEYLSEIDIDTVCVGYGEQALSILKNTPEKFSAVLLDWMMPSLNGIEVLNKILAEEETNRLPVIMQTAKVGKESMLEGLKAGAHYYISKPYDQQTLSTITATAIRDYQHYKKTKNSLKKSNQTINKMNKGIFSIKTLDEGRDVAALLANACYKSDDVVLGLTELIINAVEHGNLGIGYDEKSRLNASGELENEIERRLELPKNKDKQVIIEFCRDDTEINVSITDQGSGFDWREYMEICPDRACDSHGRGIALANRISFNEIKYLGTGNKVRVIMTDGEC